MVSSNGQASSLSAVRWLSSVRSVRTLGSINSVGSVGTHRSYGWLGWDRSASSASSIQSLFIRCRFNWDHLWSGVDWGVRSPLMRSPLRSDQILISLWSSLITPADQTLDQSENSLVIFEMSDLNTIVSVQSSFRPMRLLVFNFFQNFSAIQLRFPSGSTQKDSLWSLTTNINYLG